MVAPRAESAPPNTKSRRATHLAIFGLRHRQKHVDVVMRGSGSTRCISPAGTTPHAATDYHTRRGATAADGRDVITFIVITLRRLL